MIIHVNLAQVAQDFWQYVTLLALTIHFISVEARVDIVNTNTITSAQVNRDVNRAN